MKKGKKLRDLLINRVNDFTVMKKLTILYICCVLLPLFITDSVILSIVLSGERTEREREMQNIASAIQADISYSVDEAAGVVKSIYVSWEMNEFLNRRFESGLDFWEESQTYTKGSFISTSLLANSMSMVLYSDNETIINGGTFYRISSIKNMEWYQKLQKSNRETILHFYYIGNEQPSAAMKKKVSLITRLNYFKNSDIEKLAVVDINYSLLVRRLVSMQYNYPIYICSGNRILYSNDGYSGTSQDFDYLKGDEMMEYESRFSIHGEEIRIIFMERKDPVYDRIIQYLPLIFAMIAVNILLPSLLMYIINLSFTSRLKELSNAFDEVEAESLKEIENVRGKDEIGSLMRNYNRMVLRSQELIKTVFKDRLERQETDLARQSAELLALHSQINPHFLFNVLESIRMHSILKNENETAGMIERLAILERQNVDWKSDYVRIQDEIRFIEAYLELQKYRFGERLSYQIDIAPECAEYYLPKLTLVTFVENACIHGVEKKSVPSWIYIRAYLKGDWLYLEVEDTGDGMDELKVRELTKKMRDCNIEDLMNNEHVGIINACLRLKMVTNNKTEFELESEVGVGTFMMIKAPVDELIN